MRAQGIVITFGQKPGCEFLAVKEMIPTVYANEMFHSSGRELTLKAIQQYEPEALSDENLARIQAELDNIPAKG